MTITAKRLRAAAYGRISTVVHGQDLANQIEPIKQVAESRGFDLVKVYADEGISGATERRKGLDEMLADAKRGTFKVLIVMELSRIARDVRHLLNTLHELQQVGVSLVSIREGIEFNDTPFAKGMVTMIGLLVTIERDLLRDRIRTALAVRKAAAATTGWKCGRPSKVNPDLIDAVKKLRASGSSIRQTAKSLNISKSTVLRICRVDQNPPQENQEKARVKTGIKSGTENR
ncbi:MAG: recombinase family protein [Bdellovibrionaceae bacterium]|nr:recombinase family protein [Pseudobdellovibrionaceae bacterium]